MDDMDSGKRPVSRREFRQRQLNRRRRQRLIFLVTVSVVMLAVFAFLLAGRGGAGDDDDRSSLDVDVPVATASGDGGSSSAENIPTAATTATAVQAPPAQPLTGMVICIDPGHALNSDSTMEPIGPGAAEMKVRDPGGTSGAATGVREPVVTLAISRYLKQMLQAEGATVVMTREGEIYDGGNRERAQVANQAGADLFIRIHCDGSGNAATNGASTLYPELIPGWTDDIYSESFRAAGLVQAAMVSGMGVVDHGTVPRDDMTGFNWADVPAILVEVGFMSNAEEDLMLNDPAYQQQAARALFNGIEDYLRQP